MRQRARRAAVIAVAAALLIAGAAEAQQTPPPPPDQQFDRFAGRPLAEVRLMVEETPITNATLLSLIDLPIGQPLSIAAVRQAELRLGRLPQYEGVTVIGQDTTDGRVVITFVLEPLHAIDQLAFLFAQAAVIPHEQLNQRVRDIYGGLPTGDRIADVEETVREILAEEGYRSAVVESERVVRHNPDRATLLFKIDPGPQAIITNVQVNGESPYPVTEILARTGAKDGAPYREREIGDRLDEIRDELSAKGYYAAVARQLPAFPTESTVVLTLVVNAGPIVVLNVEPEDALPSGDRDEYIPIRRERTVDDDLLEDSEARIVAALQREGYMTAAVSHTQETPTPGRLVITFKIDRGRRHRIDHVEAPSGLALPAGQLVTLLGLSSRDVYTARDTGEGLARIVGEYRSRGFSNAVVEAPFVELPERSTADEVWGVIRLKVSEGPQATIAGITFTLEASPQVPAAALQSLMQSQPGTPYVQAIVAADQRRLYDEYARRGFTAANVRIESRLSEDERQVTLVVTANEGPRYTVGEIIVVGNERIDADEVLRELTLRVGAPLSDEARFESRRRLLATSSYRNVTITPEPPAPGETAVRVIVAVDEAPATAFGFGGGLEVRRRPVLAGVEDRFEVAPRAFIEVSRRNIGGRNRSINFFARGSLQLTDEPVEDPGTTLPNDFAEYRLTTTFREQNAFRTDSDLLIGVTSEQALRTSFNFIRRSANAEFLHRLTPTINLSGRYALEFNQIFLLDDEFQEDDLIIDRLFPQVRLSIFGGGLFWDRRDSPLAPTRGTQIVADHEVALRQVGSETGFVKTFYQVSYFRPVSADRRTVFASRVQFGAARGFKRVVPDLDESGNPIVDENGQVVTRVVDDLPASHRFFAGGSTTVRGFQLDRLGSRRQNPDGTINEHGVLNEDGLSNGGHALMLLNLELRTIVGRLFGRSFGVAGFIDGGNVFARVGHVDPRDLRGALGFGVRYDSPLGPVRLDLGFKMSRLTFARGRERGWEYHLSIGEAF
jgi:outer membrane protein assembly complex protein YaeT